MSGGKRWEWPEGHPMRRTVDEFAEEARRLAQSEMRLLGNIDALSPAAFGMVLVDETDVPRRTTDAPSTDERRLPDSVRRRTDYIPLTKEEMLDAIARDVAAGGSGSKRRVAPLLNCSVTTLKRRWAKEAPGEEWPSKRNP